MYRGGSTRLVIFASYPLKELPMSILDELVAANTRYAGARPARTLPMPPRRAVAIVTCMDARLDPARILGLEEGDAHVIRNAGGRAVESVRSLVISQRLLGTRAIALIHHTDCGMLTFSNADLQARVRRELGQDVGGIDFLPFQDLRASVQEDVRLLAASPLLEPGTPIRGYIYDVHSGRLEEVERGVTAECPA